MVTRISVLLLLGCSAAFADDAKVEPSEGQKALGALKEWRAALHSVSLTFEIAEPNGSKCIVEWDWSEDGSIRENLYFTGTAEKPGSRRATLITADRLYSMQYPEGESDYWHPDAVRLGAPSRPGSSTIVAPLYGLWYQRESDWLPDCVTEKSEWLDQADGRIALLPTPQLRLELDPAQGYLPVEAVSVPRETFHNSVREFETVQPGVLFRSGACSKNRPTGATRHEKPWEITSVRINDPATVNNFKPPVPAGTQVLSMQGKPLYVQGLGLSHEQAGYRFEPMPARRASVWNRTTTLVAGLGVMLAVGAYCLFKRQAPTR